MMTSNQKRTAALIAVGTVAAAGVLIVASRPVRASLAERGNAATLAPAPAASPITTGPVGAVETEAGNLVADALRAAARADLAFVPAAAFKPNGSVARTATGEQIATQLLEPSDESVVVVRLKGSQILEALERSVSLRPQASGTFLQVSGIRFSFDANKRANQRVSGITIGGTALDPDRVYSVAMTRSLAAGQQGYFRIWAGKSADATGKTVADALRELVGARKGMLEAALDGRIASARG
jgi:2',3'-cyclic-nucleotide 2'-phosphodiesterase (5'-nucleotidase family)